MSRIVILAVCLAFSGVAKSQIQNTRWERTLPINGDVNSILDFRDDTASLYTVADSSIVEVMTYSHTDSSVTLLKLYGQSECDSLPGKYRFAISNDSLTLTMISDQCYDRSSVIDGTKWKRWIDYPGIPLPESILKNYTGVYELDSLHPIIITLANDTLYMDGPENNLPKSPLRAVSDTRFFLRISGTTLDFTTGESGKITGMVSHESQDYNLKKVK
jgi:hypothetical protein